MASHPHIRVGYIVAGLAAVLFVLTLSKGDAQSLTGGTDPSVVIRIMGADATSPDSASTREAKLARLLDMVAKRETAALDRANRQWNDRNPEWAAMYNVVRSDLAKDSAIVGIATRLAIPPAPGFIAGIIASRLPPADVKSILAYYATPEGKRYQAFIGQIDSIYATGLAGFLNRGPAPSPALPPTRVQMEHYMEMLRLSRGFEVMIAKMEADRAAHRDISGYDMLGFLVGGAIRANRAKLDALYPTCAADLPGFETFSRSAAAQHFFLAMSVAETSLVERIRPVSAELETALQVHRANWKKLYETATAK